jgi:hypothetical protein
LSQQSAATAIARLRNSSTVIASQPDISARVLNRQLKGALKILYEELLRDLLKGLESEYKYKTRKSWVLCFCTNLILCLIVEQLQIAIDGLVIYNISKKGEDPARAIESGTKSCQQLEELPIKYSWTMFFGLYKSYNPIKNGLPPDDESGQNEGEAELINTFANMISDNGNHSPQPTCRRANLPQKTIFWSGQQIPAPAAPLKPQGSTRASGRAIHLDIFRGFCSSFCKEFLRHSEMYYQGGLRTWEIPSLNSRSADSADIFPFQVVQNMNLPEPD